MTYTLDAVVSKIKSPIVCKMDGKEMCYKQEKKDRIDLLRRRFQMTYALEGFLGLIDSPIICIIDGIETRFNDGTLWRDNLINASLSFL